MAIPINLITSGSTMTVTGTVGGLNITVDSSGNILARAKRSEAGSTGPTLGLGGGPGAVEGTNKAGETRIYAGSLVGGESADFGLWSGVVGAESKYFNVRRVSGVVYLDAGPYAASTDVLGVRGTYVNIESNVGHVALTPVTDTYIGHGAAAGDLIHHRESGTIVMDEKNDADATSWFNWISGVTAVELRHNTTARFSFTALTSSVTAPSVVLSHGTGTLDRIYHKQGSSLAWVEHNDINDNNIVVFDFGPAGEVTNLEMRGAGYTRFDLSQNYVKINTFTSSLSSDAGYHRTALENPVTFYKEVCGTTASVGAVSVTVGSILLDGNATTKIFADVVVSNDTDNEGGSFATLTKTFRRFSGGAPVLIGSGSSMGANDLDSSISTATLAITSSGNAATVVGTGVTGKTISWNSVITANQRLIT